MSSSSSPHTTNRRSLARKAQLRSSCDGCGDAKVKCDQNRPTCARCKALDQSCVYGLSRKSGKPPRKLLCLPSDMTVNLPHQQSMGQVDNTTLESPRHNKEPVISNPPHTAPNFDNTLLSDINFTPLSTISEQNHFEPPSGWSFDDWPSLDIFGFPLGMPAAILKDIPHNHQVSPSAPEPINNSTGTSNINSPSHSCTRSSYEIFRDLICLSPDLHAPDSESAPTSVQVDEILTCTRDAVDRLRQVLQCPCAKSGHRAMVHASIISRILIWYQQAAGASSLPPQVDGQVSSTPLSETLNGVNTAIEPDMTTNAQPESQVPTGFSIVHVPVTMGAFTIEDETMQATFRTQMILNELKNIGSVIDLFTSLDSAESSTPLSSTMNGGPGPGLNSHLGAWLKSEHYRIVEPLKSRLKELIQKLDI